MKKWIIVSFVLTLISFVFIYLKKYKDNIDYELDIYPDFKKNKDGNWIVPILIRVKNKNKLGFTIRDLSVNIFRKEVLFAKNDKLEDVRVSGGSTTTLTHNYIIKDIDVVKDVIFKILSKQKQEIETNISARLFFIPFNVSFKEFIP